MPARAKVAKKKPPPAVMAKTYQFTFDGKKQVLTEPQYQAEFERARKSLILRLQLIQDEARSNRREHQRWMKEDHGEGLSVGAISDMWGGVVPPSDAIWTRMSAPVNNGLKYAVEGKLEASARQLKIADQSMREVKHEWNEYLHKTVGAAESIQKGLEVTRDVSFAIAISGAAVIAAPIVATAAGTALAGAGATGATLTGLTFATTATAVTAGGAAAGGVLRGGSNLAGQAVAGGPINMSQVVDETWEGAKSGASDAAGAVVGGGAGELLGAGAKGISTVSRLVRGTGAAVSGGMASGLAGGTVEAIRDDDKGFGHVLDSTVKGGASSVLGGMFGTTVSNLTKNAPKLVQTVAGSVGDAAAAAGTALASGESIEDAGAAGLKAAVQTGVSSSARHEGGFGFGNERSEPQAGAKDQQATTQNDTPQQHQQPHEADIQQRAQQEQQQHDQQQQQEQQQSQQPDSQQSSAESLAAIAPTPEVATPLSTEAPVADASTGQTSELQPAQDAANPVTTGKLEPPQQSQEDAGAHQERREEKKSKNAKREAHKKANRAERAAGQEEASSEVPERSGKKKRRAGWGRDRESPQRRTRKESAKKLQRAVEEAASGGATHQHLSTKRKTLSKVMRLAEASGMKQVEVNALVGKVDEGLRTPTRAKKSGNKQKRFVRGNEHQPFMDPIQQSAIPDSRKARESKKSGRPRNRPLDSNWVHKGN